MADLSVSGIVAQRDKEPYVQMLIDKKQVAQFTVAEARSFANDLLLAASHAEADAMIGRFFDTMEFPPGAYQALLLEFRAFRWDQEQKLVEKTQSVPDGIKGRSNA